VLGEKRRGEHDDNPMRYEAKKTRTNEKSETHGCNHRGVEKSREQTKRIGTDQPYQKGTCKRTKRKIVTWGRRKGKGIK